MATALELVPEGEPSGAAAVLAELAALVGLVGLVLAGHFVGTADPADRLYAALLDRQVATLALGRPGADATCQDGPPGDTPDLTGDETSKPAKKPELTASHSGSGQR